MKVKTKASAADKARDCFRLATRLEKVYCAINRAYVHASDGSGDAVKYHLRPAIGLTFEIGMIHPRKKPEADKIAHELRELGRYTRDELSKKSVERLQKKLTDLGRRVGDLKSDVKSRCGIQPGD